jgi:hypothetical protein
MWVGRCVVIPSERLGRHVPVDRPLVFCLVLKFVVAGEVARKAGNPLVDFW